MEEEAWKMVGQGQAREWRSKKEARGSGLRARRKHLQYFASRCVQWSCRALRKTMYVIAML